MLRAYRYISAMMNTLTERTRLTNHLLYEFIQQAKVRVLKQLNSSIAV